MSKLSQETVSDPDLLELDNARENITSRADLLRFLDLLIEDLESDNGQERDELAVNLLEELAEVAGTGKLLYAEEGKELPREPSWKTFGDLLWDALVRI